ncbi:MAG: hypothetical protein WCR48_07520 [Bacteroidales bacterium]
MSNLLSIPRRQACCPKACTDIPQRSLDSDNGGSQCWLTFLPPIIGAAKLPP